MANELIALLAEGAAEQAMYVRLSVHHVDETIASLLKD